MDLFIGLQGALMTGQLAFSTVSDPTVSKEEATMPFMMNSQKSCVIASTLHYLSIRNKTTLEGRGIRLYFLKNESKNL